MHGDREFTRLPAPSPTAVLAVRQIVPSISDKENTNVKNQKILYWLVTGLMAAFMLLASIPDLLMSPQAVSIIGHLGYPIYLLPFLGMAKMLGVLTVLVPWFRRLKEWAFAGLVFDLTGALYSHLSVGDAASAWLPAVIGLVLVGGSYLSYQRQLIAHDGRHREQTSSPGGADNVIGASRATDNRGIHPRPVGVR
jgi:hypothetical protein